MLSARFLQHLLEVLRRIWVVGDSRERVGVLHDSLQRLAVQLKQRGDPLAQTLCSVDGGAWVGGVCGGLYAPKLLGEFLDCLWFKRLFFADVLDFVSDVGCDVWECAWCGRSRRREPACRHGEGGEERDNGED